MAFFGLPFFFFVAGDPIPERLFREFGTFFQIVPWTMGCRAVVGVPTTCGSHSFFFLGGPTVGGVATTFKKQKPTVKKRVFWTLKKRAVDDDQFQNQEAGQQIEALALLMWISHFSVLIVYIFR